MAVILLWDYAGYKGWAIWLYNHQEWVHASSTEASDPLFQFSAEAEVSTAFMFSPHMLGRGGATA